MITLKPFRPVTVVAIVLAGTLSAAGETGVTKAAEDPVVATIQGETVSAREYRLVMLREVAETFSHFKRERDLDDHAGYWKDKGDADSPIAYLRKKTLEQLKKIKTEQAMARKKGLLKDAGFAEFQQEFVKENERRAAAVAEKQVIYGPRQYNETVYYYIRFDNMAFQLRQELAKEVKVSDDSAKQWFEKHPSEVGDSKYEDIKSRILEKLKLEEAERIISAAIGSATVEVNEQAIAVIQPRSEP